MPEFALTWLDVTAERIAHPGSGKAFRLRAVAGSAI